MFQRHHVQSEEIMLITTNLRRRTPLFAHPVHARESVEMLYRIQEQYPFFLYGFVTMPDHCHFLLRVPVPGSISTIMCRYKMGVSHSIGSGPIWQSRFHIVLPKNSHAALRYIHENPVKAGLAFIPSEYPWSSACGEWDVSKLD